DEANVGKHDAKSANELDKVAVGHVRKGLKFACAGAKPGKRDGDLSFPAGAQEVFGMSSDAERFVSPIAEAVESANAETTEAGIIGALGSFETPIELAFGTSGVHVGIDSAVVSFLINNEPFRTGVDEGAILGCFH